MILSQRLGIVGFEGINSKKRVNSASEYVDTKMSQRYHESIEKKR